MDWKASLTSPVVTAVLGFVGGIVTSIATHLGKTLIDARFEARRERSAADRKLLDKLLTVLPAHGNIGYWRDHWVAPGYRSERVNELDSFCVTWIGPQYEFLGPELEKQRRLLQKRVREFTTELAINSFQRGDTDWYGLSEFWSEDERRATVKQVDALADAMVAAYGEMVRTAR